ncbi:MAG: hypothetical protein R3C05_09695 [Pirellulaceae bacterium]
MVRIFRFTRDKVVLAALLATISSILVPSAWGEEPAENFLKQLRANRYFDMALLYLDRIEKGAIAPDDLRSAIELERAQTYLEMAATTRTLKVQTKTSSRRKLRCARLSTTTRNIRVLPKPDCNWAKSC